VMVDILTQSGDGCEWGGGSGDKIREVAE
jgi:hypothetical protein